jgi:hypothetical protein
MLFSQAINSSLIVSPESDEKDLLGGARNERFTSFIVKGYNCIFQDERHVEKMKNLTDWEVVDIFQFFPSTTSGPTTTATTAKISRRKNKMSN